LFENQKILICHSLGIRSN